MDKFCEKCGTPINPMTGTCPKCNGPITNFETKKAAENIMFKDKKMQTKEQKKQNWEVAKQRYRSDLAAKKKLLKEKKREMNAAKRAAMSTKQKVGRVLVKFTIIIVLLALLVGGAFLGLKKLGLFKKDVPGATNNENTQTNTLENEHSGGSIGIYNPPGDAMPENYKNEKPDADAYFAENATVISAENASGLGSTEAATYKNLSERGFVQNPITTQYSMDGTYMQEKEISSAVQDRHPTYQTYYQTQSGDFWSVYEINGAVFANPVFYNLDNDTGIQLLISETDTLTSYDSTKNKFYVTKPNEDVVTLKTVAKIDAATLETLTAGEIDNL